MSDRVIESVIIGVSVALIMKYILENKNSKNTPEGRN